MEVVKDLKTGDIIKHVVSEVGKYDGNCLYTALEINSTPVIEYVDTLKIMTIAVCL